MNQVGFHAGQRLSFHENGKRLVLFRRHQTAEPRFLRKLRGGIRGEMYLVGSELRVISAAKHSRCFYRLVKQRNKYTYIIYIYLLGTREQFATMKSRTAEERVLDDCQPRFPVMGAGASAGVGRSWRCNADRNYCETGYVLYLR